MAKTAQKSKPEGDDFLSQLSAPARHALQNKGISTVQQLSQFTEADILKLHGMGRASLPKLRNALVQNGLLFKQKL